MRTGNLKGLFMATKLTALQTQGVATRIEQITPQQAHSFLENSARNRKLSMSTVRQYAAAMTKGQWHIGQPITFDHAGRLIDGQHRLRAVILSGEPCDFIVIRGVNTKAFAVFDIGRKRSAADVLEILEIPNCKDLAATSKAVLSYEHGLTSLPAGGSSSGGGNINSVLTVEDIVARAKNDAAMRECIARISDDYRESRRLMRSGGLAGALLYFFEKISDADAHNFFGVLSDKATQDTEHPAWQLKMKLQRHMGREDRLGSHQIAGLAVKAWNIFHLRKPPQQLRYNAYVESVPKIAGYPYGGK